MFNLSEIIKNKLQESSQHFQVALQAMDLKPWKVKRIIETGYAMYRGTKNANYPLFLHIEPTGMCNLKCTMCPRGESITRELKHMPFDKFKIICDSVNPVFIGFVGFGEPLMNPQILDMVRYSVKKGIIARISSNATMLTPQRSLDIMMTGLQQIWFSIDSPTPENFERIRVGARFDKVISGVKEFLRIRDEVKSKIIVTINFTITRENVHEVARMVEFCHREFPSIVLTFARSYGYDIEQQRNRALQNTSEIQGYLKEAVALAVQYKLSEIEQNLKTIINDLKFPLDGKGPCYFPYYVVAVAWDGKVSPCCLYYNYQMDLGNALTKPFSQIWNGPTYQQFRINLKTQRQAINICNTCPLSDISLHNIMHKISSIPGAKFFTKEKYDYIDINERIYKHN